MSDRAQEILDYYVTLTKDVARRSTCKRRKIGAIAVLDDRIVATGFNGQIPGTPHCSVCLRDILNIPSGQDTNTCRAIHAEQNLIVQAACHGVSLKGATIYCTHKPCYTCFKMLMSLFPLAIIYEEDYPCSQTDREMAANSWFGFSWGSWHIVGRQPLAAQPLLGIAKGITYAHP